MDPPTHYIRQRNLSKGWNKTKIETNGRFHPFPKPEERICINNTTLREECHLESFIAQAFKKKICQVPEIEPQQAMEGAGKEYQVPNAELQQAL